MSWNIIPIHGNGIFKLTLLSLMFYIVLLPSLSFSMLFIIVSSVCRYSIQVTIWQLQGSMKSLQAWSLDIFRRVGRICSMCQGCYTSQPGFRLQVKRGSIWLLVVSTAMSPDTIKILNKYLLNIFLRQNLRKCMNQSFM